MKRILRHAFSLFITAILACTLAACGSSEGQGTAASSDEAHTHEDGSSHAHGEDAHTHDADTSTTRLDMSGMSEGSDMDGDSTHAHEGEEHSHDGEAHSHQ